MGQRQRQLDWQTAGRQRDKQADNKSGGEIKKHTWIDARGRRRQADTEDGWQEAEGRGQRSEDEGTRGTDKRLHTYFELPLLLLKLLDSSCGCPAAEASSSRYTVGSGKQSSDFYFEIIFDPAFAYTY